MSNGLYFWLSKRASDPIIRATARNDMRIRLQNQSRDLRRRGKGNKAFRRIAALDAGALHLAGNIYVV